MGEGQTHQKKNLTNKIKPKKKNGKGQLNSQIIKFMKFRSDHLTSISLSFSLGFLQLLTCFRKSGGATTSLFTFKKKVFCDKKKEGRPPSRPLLMLCAWLLKTTLADGLIRAPQETYNRFKMMCCIPTWQMCRCHLPMKCI